MKYKLPQHFKDGDITPPKVRIGIDYGDKEKTIWSYYGLKYCSELTTTGLHTDLAAKLQNKADPNGIRVGDNVVQMLDLEDKFVKTDPNEEFIFDNSYRQYIFNWEEYLLSFDFIKRDSNRNVIIEKPSYRLSCEISEQDKDQYVPYRQNLYSIPKHYKIRFTLLENDIPYKLKIAFDEHLEWKIVNTGKEATKAQKIKETIQPAKDSVICVVDALFLGHHEMQCKIIKSGGISNINVRHSVFVR